MVSFISHTLSSVFALSFSLSASAFTDAGVDYKNIIKADLEKDPRVESVIDVGVNASSDKTGEHHS